MPPVERHELRRGALRVALVYALFAALWILLSDRAMGLVWQDPQSLVRASMLKGWFFVAVTTLLLYVLVRRLVGQLDAAHRREQAHAEEKARAQQLLAAIARSSSDAIFAKDEQGRYLFVNDAAALPPEQAAMIRSLDQRVLASGRVEPRRNAWTPRRGTSTGRSASPATSPSAPPPNSGWPSPRPATARCSRT